MGSWWVWAFVAVVALYLGFYYRPRVTSYTFEILGGPGLDPSFPSPTRHFRLVVRDSEGRKTLPSRMQASGIRISWSTVPPIPGLPGRPAVSEVHDAGGGEYLVTFRVAAGVPTGHALRLRASYGDRETPFSVEPTELSIPGPIHEPSCTAPIQLSVWTEAMGCPRSFPQLEEVSQFPSSSYLVTKFAVLPGRCI